MQKVCRNSLIFDGMTLGIFTISTSWKVVTLSHGNFQKPAMSILPVFDAKLPFSGVVTLSRSRAFHEYKGISWI